MQSELVVAENVEGKFGPQLKGTDGNYYSFGNYYKGNKVFNPGTKLVVDLFVSEKGNKYVNKVIESKTDSVEVNHQSSKPKRGRPAKVSDTGLPVSLTSKVEYKPRDYDKEARGKTRCAAMTAVLSPMLPILVTNPSNMEEVKEKAMELAEFIVEYSFQDTDL